MDLEYDSVYSVKLAILNKLNSRTFTVTYDNCCELVVDRRRYNSGDTVTVKDYNYDCSLTHGTRFAGWEDENGILHQPNSTFTITDDTTLTAIIESIY